MERNDFTFLDLIHFKGNISSDYSLISCQCFVVPLGQANAINVVRNLSQAGKTWICVPDRTFILYVEIHLK